MNIEDIKNSVVNFKHDLIVSRECCDTVDFSDEVLYLLSIIDRQNKALSDAKEALDNQYRFNGGVIENNKAYMAIFNGLTILKL